MSVKIKEFSSKESFKGDMRIGGGNQVESKVVVSNRDWVGGAEQIRCRRQWALELRRSVRISTSLSAMIDGMMAASQC